MDKELAMQTWETRVEIATTHIQAKHSDACLTDSSARGASLVKIASGPWEILSKNTRGERWAPCIYSPHPNTQIKERKV